MSTQMLILRQLSPDIYHFTLKIVIFKRISGQ